MECKGFKMVGKHNNKADLSNVLKAKTVAQYLEEQNDLYFGLLSGMSAMDNALKDFEEQFKSQTELSGISAMESAINSFEEQYRLNMRPVLGTSSIEDALNSFEEQYKPQIELISTTSVLENTLRSFEEQYRSHDNLGLDIFVKNSTRKLFEQHMPVHLNLLADLNIAKQLAGGVLRSTVDTFSETYSSVLDPLQNTTDAKIGNFLDELPLSAFGDVAKLLGEVDLAFFESIDDRKKNAGFNEAVVEAAEFICFVNSGSEVNSFKLHPTVKKVLYDLFIALLVSIFMLLMAKANNAFDEYWNEQEISTKADVKKALKKMPMNIDCSMLKDIRIVTGDRVYIRSEPKQSKGNALGFLYRNDRVTVLKKERRWSQVEAKVNGEILEGWVSNIYLLSVDR